MRPMFDPAKMYDESDPEWHWNPYKFDMKNEDIVGRLWLKYNTVAALPILSHMAFRDEVKRISARSKTRANFKAAMQSNSHSRFEEQEAKLEKILYEIAGNPRRMPPKISLAVLALGRAASMDNLHALLKALHEHEWPSSSPPGDKSPVVYEYDSSIDYTQGPDFSMEKFLKSLRRPAKTENRGEDPDVDQDDPQPQQRTPPLQQGPQSRNSSLKRRRDQSQGGCGDNDGGENDNTQKWSPGPPPKRLKSTHSEGSTRRRGLQPTNTTSAPPGHERHLSSSSADHPVTSSVSTIPTDSVSTIPTDVEQQPVRPINGKRMRYELEDERHELEDDRPGGAKRRKTTRAPQPRASDPPPQQSAPSAVPPASTRRQTRSAKATTALLELDGHGRPLRQTSRASRRAPNVDNDNDINIDNDTRDGGQRLDKVGTVDKQPAGGAKTGQPRSQGTQGKRSGLRSRAKQR